jgi:hypothetical protein
VKRNSGLVTQGLAARGQLELAIDPDPSLVDESRQLLRYILDYIETSDAVINPGETLGYGYWLIKFVAGDDRFLHIHEYNSEATDFVPGAALTVSYWRDQHRICEKFGGEFMPPRPDKLVVISDGVMEGDAVQGVRYPSPDHMSGWWITTDRYDGNIRSLKREHLYHVTAARPDLAQYVALPYGFRFDLSQGQDVWFDPKVASQPPE